MTTMRIAALQCELGEGSVKNNARIETMIREVAPECDLVLPPELFDAHYFPQLESEAHFDLAHPLDEHPTVERFRKLSAELDIAIPISVFERDGQQYYNTIVMVEAGEKLGIYRKSHIPDGPGYEEKFFFRPGNTGFQVFASRKGNVGIGICWDQWFPEAARSMTLLGADVLLYPTAIGSEPEEAELDTKDPWQRVMIGHAVANAIPVVAANRIGQENAIDFYGSSFICNERGDKLAELSRTESGSIVAEFDFEKVRRYRANFGFFRDRRPDLYAEIVKQ